MAFSDDSVLARLSSLNESHDSIATAAQWIMFHRRHADRTVQIWLQRLRESSSTRRLSLVYLANEVTQQSKARNRLDFVLAFSPVIGEALGVAYKGAPSEIQGKLKRVVEVWADRNIFEPPIQAAIEARMQDADKGRGAPRNGGFGVNPMSVPSDLASLTTMYQNVEKISLPTKTSLGTAEQDWEKVQDPANPVPSAPVYAARLNGLLRSLAAAEGAVAESVKARQELAAELEKLTKTNSDALADEQRRLTTISGRKVETEEKRKEVELAIMRTLPSHEVEGEVRDGHSQSPGPDHQRPEIEELTPPPPDIEELTPPPETGPLLSATELQTDPVSIGREQKYSISASVPIDGPAQSRSASGIEMLSDLASQYQSLPITANSPNKRRKVDADEFPDLGGDDDGIDEDVAEILRRESNGA